MEKFLVVGKCSQCKVRGFKVSKPSEGAGKVMALFTLVCTKVNFAFSMFHNVEQC